MKLELIIKEPKMWGEVVEKQIRARIRVAVAAYAYSIKSNPIMTKQEFKKLASEVDTSIHTGNQKLDQFFKREFDANSTHWIQLHPNLSAIRTLYHKYYTN